MARRLVQLNSVQDFSSLDEPVLPLGPLYLSFRRALYLALAAALLAGLASALRGPVIASLPGGFPVTPGLLLGVLAAGPLLALGLQEPGALSPEAQLLLMLLPPAPPGPRGAQGGEGEEYTLTADPDLGVAEAELVGVAVDPGTGRPYPSIGRALVEATGRRLEVPVSPSDRYRLSVELPRGFHVIRVLAPDSNMELRRLMIRVA